MNGGPAFPRHALQIKLPSGAVVPQDPGMTLRDYFAAKAMQSFVLNKNILLDDAAELAYKMADAMLRAREK